MVQADNWGGGRLHFQHYCWLWHLMSERLLNCVFDSEVSALPALLHQEDTSNRSLRGANWLKRCFNCADSTPLYFTGVLVHQVSSEQRGVKRLWLFRAFR